MTRLSTGMPALRGRRSALAGAMVAVGIAVSGLTLAGAHKPQPGETVPAPATPPAPAPTGISTAAQPDPGPGSPASSSREIQESELILKDGRRITGILVESAQDEVVLLVSNVRTAFKRSQVERVRPLPSVEERYRSLRQAIDPEDLDGTLRLAEWLRARARYDLALVEVNRAMEIEPGNPEARALRTLIEAQSRLVDDVGRGREAAPASRRNVRSEFPLLNDEQINLIRVFEVNLKNPPRMLISRDVVKRFLQQYEGTQVGGRGTVPSTPEGRELFYRLKPHEILGWMFDLKAREFYPQVKVLENPRSMRLFRDNVHRGWLMNSCATTRCHGGEEAGRLWLFNRRTNSDQTVYTNFLILERFKVQGGQPLINYNEPARSPLLQFALPRDRAVYKHPEVAGMGRGMWRPVFQSQDDPRFKEAVEWILAMYPKRPDYPVEYQPPVPGTGVLMPDLPEGEEGAAPEAKPR